MGDLQIVYLPPEELNVYERNARRHEADDLAAIKASIQEFGFLDPIAIWGDSNTIVEGHGRRTVALEMGLSTVPCIRLDKLTDEQRRAYTLAHNKTAEASSWDFNILDKELADLRTAFDMSSFSFDCDMLPPDISQFQIETGERTSNKNEHTIICPKCGAVIK